MRRLDVLPVFALCLALAATRPAAGSSTAKGAGKTDEDLIQGRWVATRINRDGREFGPEQLARAGQSLHFEGEDVTMASGGRGEPATFTLDSRGGPKRLTITPNDKKVDANVLLYDLDGDTLRVSTTIGEPSCAPEAFDPKAGRIVMTFERKKE